MFACSFSMGACRKMGLTAWGAATYFPRPILMGSHSSMDRASASEAENPGSSPGGSATCRSDQCALLEKCGLGEVADSLLCCVASEQVL